MRTVDKLDFFTTVCNETPSRGFLLCIIKESTRFSRMPTATVSKSIAAPKARKTRTRKAPAKKAAPAAIKATAPKKQSVSKVTVTTFKGGKVVAKVTTLKRPSSARLISSDRYLKDIQTRWQIHQFEIQELVKDFRKGFDLVTPYHAQLVNQVKQWTV